MTHTITTTSIHRGDLIAGVIIVDDDVRLLQQVAMGAVDGPGFERELVQMAFRLAARMAAEIVAAAPEPGEVVDVVVSAICSPASSGPHIVAARADG